MKCPNCSLENPPTSILCDCGYNFETKKNKPVLVRKNLFNVPITFEWKLPFKFKISDVPETIKNSRKWIIINIVGLSTNLFLAFMAGPFNYNWKLTAQVDVVPWESSNFLIFFLFFLVNLVWLIRNLWRRNRPAVFVWLLVVLVWVFVISIEFYYLNLVSAS